MDIAAGRAEKPGADPFDFVRTYAEWRARYQDLLSGLEPKDAHARRLRTLCGIRPGSPIAVAVARPFQSGNGKAIDLEVTLRYFVCLIQQVLPSTVFGKLVEIRNGEITGIISSHADTAHRFLKALRRHGAGRRGAIGAAWESV